MVYGDKLSRVYDKVIYYFACLDFFIIVNFISSLATIIFQKLSSLILR